MFSRHSAWMRVSWENQKRLPLSISSACSAATGGAVDAAPVPAAGAGGAEPAGAVRLPRPVRPFPVPVMVPSPCHAARPAVSGERRLAPPQTPGNGPRYSHRYTASALSARGETPADTAKPGSH
jgi:hypothetical protein